MEPTAFLIQFLDGMAVASSLFFVAAGLSLIFGVTRVVNFAHGSLFMLGAYIAYSLVTRLPHTALGFWGGVALAALAVGALGAAVEMAVLRRIYRAPELFQLLATFGIVLVVADAVLMIWGPQDLLGPRAPGLDGVVRLFGRVYPQYELFLIVLGPAVLGVMWLAFRRTRWGILVRAATEDREMLSALGVNQAWLFTSVFFLGALLAGLGGALQLPREAVTHRMDLQAIVEAFVVVVVGGMGSLPGAYLAAVLIGQLHAFGILLFPQSTLVLMFLAMAVVLVVRPAGLLGQEEPPIRHPAHEAQALAAWSGPGFGWPLWGVLAVLALLPVVLGSYGLYVVTEILIFALFGASLHLFLSGGGMISFGHAAYFGLGAYGVALAVTYLHAPLALALALGVVSGGAGALLYGWFVVRRSGIYLAMLTLAFAQITYAIAFQWYAVTGGDNGLLGIWPPGWAAGRTAFYYLTLGLCAAGVLALRHALFTPFGHALRAVRDAATRAEAVGLHSRRHQWLAFALGGAFAGLAGALYAYFKGSVFPESLAITTSVDALVIVLLGGINTLSGPIVGAAVYKALQIVMTSYTDYWQMVLGAFIVVLVVAAPQGLVGYARLWAQRLRRRP